MTTTNVKDLPFDIIYQILYRLPVKALLRFRCVSKLYRETIDDPIFIRVHHARESHTLSFGYTASRIFELEANDGELVGPRCRTPPLIYKRFQFLCSREGFLLLLQDDQIWLCNPSTRESIVVASVPIAIGIRKMCFCFFRLKFESTMKEYYIVYGFQKYGKTLDRLIYSSERKSWNRVGPLKPSSIPGLNPGGEHWKIVEIVDPEGQEKLGYQAFYCPGEWLKRTPGSKIIGCKATLISPKHF